MILNEISKKVSTEHDFFVYDQRKATKIFLKSMANKGDRHCYIVYPLFDNEYTFFDEDDKSAREYLEYNIKLIQDGLVITRVFIIDEQEEISHYFIESCHKLLEHGVEIYIVLKKDVQNLTISSYDFIYDAKQDFAMYKTPTNKKYIFQITKNRDKIKELTYDYQKIKDISFVFDELLLQKVQNDNINYNKIQNTYLREKYFLLSSDFFVNYKLVKDESHILGKKIFYIDNDINSNHLVFMFHGLGLDCNDFREYIEKSSYRCIAPTLYGFNKDESVNKSISYETHCYVLYILIKQHINTIKPKFVTLVGFSIGGDMIQDILNYDSSLTKDINSILILDGNININTCTISKRIASLDYNNMENIMNVIHSFNTSINNLEDWLQIQQYLIKVFSKFINRLNILKLFSQEIVNRFNNDNGHGFEYFTANFNNISNKVNHIQYIYSDDTIHTDLINKLNFINLNQSILNKHHEKIIKIENDNIHFDLLKYKNLKKYIDQSYTYCTKDISISINK